MKKTVTTPALVAGSIRVIIISQKCNSCAVVARVMAVVASNASGRGV